MQINRNVDSASSGNGLITGIDIGRDVSMASYFNESDLSAGNVVFPDGSGYKENPVTAD